ncbi:hypothetical protein GGR57DRAFT_351922 [Xylariaceae sp. FL1272]|nr:hypothetical protein GGR57DRAFT_351922 [Xylariaceae sp. FL1272]
MPPSSSHKKEHGKNRYFLINPQIKHGKKETNERTYYDRTTSPFSSSYSKSRREYRRANLGGYLSRLFGRWGRDGGGASVGIERSSRHGRHGDDKAEDISGGAEASPKDKSEVIMTFSTFDIQSHRPPELEGVGPYVSLDGAGQYPLDQRTYTSCVSVPLSVPGPQDDDRSSTGQRTGSDTTDSEIDWLSDFSEDTPQIDANHPLFWLRGDFLRSVLNTYDQDVRKRGGNEAERGTSTYTIPSGLGNGVQKGSGRTEKRKRNQSSNGGSSGDEEQAPRNKKEKIRAESRRQQLVLACPFMKKDPIHYRSCNRYTLMKIRYVKQHIYRCHSMPLYCPRCMETFPHEDSRDVHIRSIDCQEQPLQQPIGITAKQKTLLGQRVPSKVTEEEQWFTVFDILFPNQTRPKSPYVDQELSEELCNFRDHLVADGPRLLTDFLRARGVEFSTTSSEGERHATVMIHSTIADGLHQISEKWERSNENFRQLENNESNHNECATQVAPEPTTIDSVTVAGLVGDRLLNDAKNLTTEETQQANRAAGKNDETFGHELGFLTWPNSHQQSFPNFEDIFSGQVDLTNSNLDFGWDTGRLDLRSPDNGMVPSV